jgi:pyruvate/2-oxoglutarate dehydrogenase complex dihydrolipoamide dehydrogenase (E3) component
MTPRQVEEADLVVIGSGQGGVPLAADFGNEGKRVVLFERGALGGSCVNYGCTPSKAFLGSAHAAGRARAASGLAVSADVRADVPAVFERVRRLRGEWRDGVGERLEAAGVDVVNAEAAFVGVRTVAGGGRTVRGALVVIDTGTTAAIPPVEGLAGTPYLTNKTFFDLPDLPRHLIVLGGGYIGLELGQGARRLGAEVTIVHRGSRPLEAEEADASDVIREGLEADGVRFRFGTQPRSVAHAGGSFSVAFDDGAPLEGDALLIATGRTPNTAELSLEASGIGVSSRGYVEADDYLRTACGGVFAVGDVAGQPAFTHVAWEDYRRILSTLRGSPRRRDDRVLSYSTFTEPQLARTGLTEAQAHAKGIAARSVTLPLSRVARAIEWDLERGFFRLVVDRSTDRILGATFVGYEAGELIHIILTHIEAGSTWQALDRAMHIHPTFAEGLPTLARMLA